MVNLANTKGNNTTGVHMLQRDKNGGFRIRTSPDSLKRFTSVEVRPEHRGRFKGKNEIYSSEPYNTIEEDAAALVSVQREPSGHNLKHPTKWCPPNK